MWRLKPSMGSTLYFTLRYPMLFNTIAVVLVYLSWGSWQSQLVSAIGAVVEYDSEQLSSPTAPCTEVSDQALCVHEPHS